MKYLLITFVLLTLILPLSTTAQEPDPFEPVKHNTDWTPIEQDFDGVTMVLVPAGCFMMGSTEEEVEVLIAEYEGYSKLKAEFEAELPQHEQCFEDPFWIDKYEVTQGDFQRLGGVQKVAPAYSGDNHPVENVRWFESRDYCELRGARLPTDPEWEYAARGPDNLSYPWGDELDWSYVVGNVYVLGDPPHTAEVGSKPAGISWVGAMDMAGNVWEWVSTIYDPKRFPYPYQIDDGREDADDTKSARSFRGSAWNLGENHRFMFRTAYRLKATPVSLFRDTGFRCVRDYE